jgi:hypothetical protein
MQCASCGAEHAWSELEPSYTYPDAVLAVPATERDSRTVRGADICGVRHAGDVPAQVFLRAVLPIPVRGTAQACNWGIWVELSVAAMDRIYELWSAPEQSTEPPFDARLANALQGYEATLGLRGSLQLVGPKSRPHFTLDGSIAHPLVREQADGVFPERVLEWLHVHVGQ